MPDGTFHAIACAVTFHRIDRVVISRPGLKAIDTHAEYRVGMITIQPDVGFRDLVGSVPYVTTPKCSSVPPGLFLVHRIMSLLLLCYPIRSPYPRDVYV